MNRYQWILLVTVLFVPLLAKGGVVQFDTLPSGGTLAPVAPGTTVGWGYSFDVTLNPSETFMLVGVSDSGFPAGSGTPSSAVFDYPIFSSTGVYSTPWVPGTSGLYEFTWNPGTSGQTVSGTFTVDGQFWDGDPSNPASTLEDDVLLDTPFTSTTTTPEPSTGWILGFSISAFLWMRRRSGPFAHPRSNSGRH